MLHDPSAVSSNERPASTKRRWMQKPEWADRECLFHALLDQLLRAGPSSVPLRRAVPPQREEALPPQRYAESYRR